MSVASVVLTENVKATLAASFGTKVSAKQRDTEEVRQVRKCGHLRGGVGRGRLYEGVGGWGRGWERLIGGEEGKELRTAHTRTRTHTLSLCFSHVHTCRQ